MSELEEGQIVLCTVKKIVGTTVFVNIDEYDKEGTIITSEIAPGRIRNLRDYVTPNKKIACKILKIEKGHIALSLRRVTAKEKRELNDNYKKEKSLAAALKTISEDSEKIISKIKEKSNLTDFFEEASENPKLLEKFMSKKEAEKILKIIREKKEKEVSVKKTFSLTCEEGEGIEKIKKVLPEETTYISAGNFSLKIKDKNYKDANYKADKLLEEIENKAKQQKCVFSIEKQTK